MEWIRNVHGQPRRPWYHDDEIERIVSGRVLRASVNGATAPVVDLELFAEQHCGVALDQYASLPRGILGATEFLADGTVRVYIDRELTFAAEAPTADISRIGRWRATLAHELGHVILHHILFDDNEDQLGLFEVDELEPRRVNCLPQTIGVAPLENWREVQANKAMAAMLMPRTSFTAYAEDLLKERRDEVLMPWIVEKVARTFLVSRQAAAIRLDELGLLGSRVRLL